RGVWCVRTVNSPPPSLGQQPLRPPSVFNFFRPGYVPPNTAIAAANLVAPEFQITGETSVAGYSSFRQAVVASGVGIGREVRAAYSTELAMANDADALIGRVNRCLMAGAMGTTQQQEIRDAVNAISPATPNGPANRVYTAVLLTMVSPEYLVQK